jgi:hypothetical protein
MTGVGRLLWWLVWAALVVFLALVALRLGRVLGMGRLAPLLIALGVLFVVAVASGILLARRRERPRR